MFVGLEVAKNVGTLLKIVSYAYASELSRLCLDRNLFFESLV